MAPLDAIEWSEEEDTLWVTSMRILNWLKYFCCTCLRESHAVKAESSLPQNCDIIVGYNIVLYRKSWLYLHVVISSTFCCSSFLSFSLLCTITRHLLDFLPVSSRSELHHTRQLAGELKTKQNKTKCDSEISCSLTKADDALLVRWVLI